MASGTALESNVEIVREYTRRVFNAHDPTWRRVRHS